MTPSAVNDGDKMRPRPSGNQKANRYYSSLRSQAHSLAKLMKFKLVSITSRRAINPRRSILGPLSRRSNQDQTLGRNGFGQDLHQRWAPTARPCHFRTKACRPIVFRPWVFRRTPSNTSSVITTTRPVTPFNRHLHREGPSINEEMNARLAATGSLISRMTLSSLPAYLHLRIGLPDDFRALRWKSKRRRDKRVLFGEIDQGLIGTTLSSRPVDSA